MLATEELCTHTIHMYIYIYGYIYIYICMNLVASWWPCHLLALVSTVSGVRISGFGFRLRFVCTASGWRFDLQPALLLSGLQLLPPADGCDVM
jgi:hypothetical protein